MITKHMKVKVTLAAAVAVTTLMAPLAGTIAEATTLKAQSNVNVRSAASNQASKVGYATSGKVVDYLGTEGNWYKIRIDGIQGYSHINYWNGHTVSVSRNVNVRSGASNISSKVGYATTGTEAALLGRNGSWIFIDLNGTLGFSHKNYWDLSDTLFNSLTLVGPEVPSTPQTPPPTAPAPQDPAPAPPQEIEAGAAYKLHVDVKGYVTAGDAAAGTNPANTRTAGDYFIYKESSGMLNVSAYQGSPGAWINPADNSADSAPPSKEDPAVAQKVLDAAFSLIGAPYVFGGEYWSDGGFDCSGLTRYAYRAAGIKIPRTASQQWNGISQKVSEPIPGDIIAFSRDGDIYHVGIYIGENKMIHSPEPGKFVEIRDLSWHYRNNRVHGFLRPAK